PGSHGHWDRRTDYQCGSRPEKNLHFFVKFFSFAKLDARVLNRCLSRDHMLPKPVECRQVFDLIEIMTHKVRPITFDRQIGPSALDFLPEFFLRFDKIMMDARNVIAASGIKRTQKWKSGGIEL